MPSKIKDASRELRKQFKLSGVDSRRVARIVTRASLEHNIEAVEADTAFYDHNLTGWSQRKDGWYANCEYCGLQAFASEKEYGGEATESKCEYALGGV